MADVTSRNEIAANNSTSGSPVYTTTFGANYEKIAINQADVGRELIVKVAKTDMTSAELNTIIKGITQAGGDGTGTDKTGEDAFTVAAVATATGAAFVSGTTDVVFLRVQGTGTLTADGSDAYGVTGAATTIEAVFQPAL
jgi:hypothetical protein